MISWFLKQLNRIPQPWRLILFVGIVFAFLVVVFTLLNQVQSCGRDKARKEYEQESKNRAAQISQLEGENTQLRQQIAELEPKALALQAIIDSKVKVDEGLKDEIARVTEEAANAESVANQHINCRDRANRICALFRATDPRFDCAVIFAECE